MGPVRGATRPSASLLRIRADRIARRLWPGLVEPPRIEDEAPDEFRPELLKPLVPVLEDLARLR